MSEEEARVGRVLAAWQQRLPAEAQDIIGLATAFRDPPIEDRLKEYLGSAPVQTLLHETWRASYEAFKARPGRMVVEAIRRPGSSALLERVGRYGPASAGAAPVSTPIRSSVAPSSMSSEAHGRREGARGAGGLPARPPRPSPAHDAGRGAKKWKCSTPIATPAYGMKRTAPMSLLIIPNIVSSLPHWSASLLLALLSRWRLATAAPVVGIRTLAEPGDLPGNARPV